MDKKQIQEELFRQRDEAYAAMQLRIIPTVAEARLIGVRTPILRALAKKLSVDDDAVLPYLEERRLDTWTHNKTIQKSVESFRISAEQKAFLKTLCETERIRFARVEAIGAADHTVLGVFDPETQDYIAEEINAFLEIASLTGNITVMHGKPYIHLHATLADQRHVIHGGHVLRMRVGLTCEMFVTILEGNVTRARDEALGINLWDF